MNSKGKGNRLKNSFDREANILGHFRTSYKSELCCLIPQSDDLDSLVQIVANEKGWTDCSGKDVPPPDFTNDIHQLMLEVMRVDDHERLGRKKGRVVNPLRERETKILIEYDSQFRDLLGMAADGAELIVLGKTDLEGEEDHSYRKYVAAFARIVDKHARHADEYRLNHPNMRLIFFVFDESASYFAALDRDAAVMPRAVGDSFAGRPHFFFADKAFLDVIKRSKADYFVWYTPFKQTQLFAKDIVLPDAVVYDVNRMAVRELTYNPELMVCCEV